MKLTLGPVAVDLISREINNNGRLSTLTPTDAALLTYLAERRGQTVSRAELLVHALGYAETVQSRAVDHAMGRLRKKIEADPRTPQFLTAIRGMGYRLDLPPERDTGFVGRLVELSAVQRDLDSGITVILGPGGIGKTRFARVVQVRWGQPSTFVDLTSARDAQDMLGRVARAFDTPLLSRTHTEQGTQLGAMLASRGRHLLVLDNLEQLPDSAVAVLDAWHIAAPEVVLLVTSRRRLDLRDTHEHHLAPLDGESAVQLYQQQAQKHRPGFSLTNVDRDHVLAFVPAVDGLPLAIELAASRIEVLSPAALMAWVVPQRTEGGWSASHAEDALADCILRSWDLLTSQQRQGWMAAAAFEGGFTQADWSFVAAIPDGLDLLQSLLAHQLVYTVTGVVGPRRFDLLVTLKRFARARLAESPERAAIERRHWTCMQRHADARARDVEVTGDQTWPQAERGNVRLAFERALRVEPEAAVGCLRMMEVLFKDGGSTELRISLHERVLGALGPSSPIAVREGLHSRLCLARLAAGQRAQADAEAAQAFALQQHLTTPKAQARGWIGRGSYFLHTGQASEAEHAFERSQAAAGLAGDVFYLGLSHYNRSYSLELQGRSDAALDAIHLAIEHFSTLHTSTLMAAAYGLLAYILINQGELNQARPALAKAAQVKGVKAGIVWLDIRFTRAHLELASGDAQTALHEFESGVEAARTLGFEALLANFRSGRALALADLGHWDLADLAFQQARASQQRRNNTGQAGLALAMSGAVQWMRGSSVSGLRRLNAAKIEVADCGVLVEAPVDCLLAIAVAKSDHSLAERLLADLRSLSEAPGKVVLALGDLAEVAVHPPHPTALNVALEHASRVQGSSPEVRLALSMLGHLRD